MIPLILAISAFFVSGSYSNIKIKTISGDIDIKLKPVKGIEILDDAGIEETDSTLLIRGRHDDLTVTLPESTKLVSASSTDGNITVSGQNVHQLNVKSLYGDLTLRIGKAEKLSAKSRSGTIYLRLEQCGNVSVRSFTGDIVYYGPVCDSLEITSNSGDIDIYTHRAPASITNVRSKFGRVSLYDLGTGKLIVMSSPESEEKILKIIEFSIEPPFESRDHLPLSTWNRFPIEYTSVDGLTLNFPFGDNKGDDFYGGYVGYSFAAERVDFYLHGLKSFGHFCIYFRGYSERRAQDAMFLSSEENTISSLLLHSTYTDFYHSKGIGIFGGLVFKNFWLKAGYERKTLTGMETVTNWSLFYRRSRTFPPNPPILEGSAEFMSSEAEFKSRNLLARMSLEKQINPNYPEFLKATGILRGRFKTEDIEFLPVISGIYSTDSLVAPFDFHLGGPFTMPGYRWKEFHGSKWMFLVNLTAKISILDENFFIRFDAGQTDESDDVFYDLGAGIISDDWYLGIASPINGEGYRIFAGLNWRFKW